MKRVIEDICNEIEVRHDKDNVPALCSNFITYEERSGFFNPAKVNYMMHFWDIVISEGSFVKSNTFEEFLDLKNAPYRKDNFKFLLKELKEDKGCVEEETLYLLDKYERMIDLAEKHQQEYIKLRTEISQELIKDLSHGYDGKQSLGIDITKKRKLLK